MSLSDEQIKKFRDELKSSYNPLYFFDDDPDGLASFLLFYRFVREGRGVVVKAKPILDEKYLRKVKEHTPDKIFVLDKPDISQEFIDGAKTKIIWLDHHALKEKQGVSYFNPMVDKGDNTPTSYWAYKIVEKDFWIAMVGIVGDWFLPDFSEEFSNKYPDLLPKGVSSPEQALFETKLGKLIRIFSFVLKGKTSEVKKCIKVLTRIESPYEILNQTTSKGKFIYKKFEKLNVQYEEMINDAVKNSKIMGDLFVYIYDNQKVCFTGNLSNELLYKYNDKIVIIGRSKSGEMKCSLRSGTKKVLPILKKALEGVDGYGGGHEFACGVCVKVEDWDKFLEQFKNQAALAK